MRIRQEFTFAAVLSAVALVSGCASEQLGTARELSTAGSQASARLLSAAGDLQQTFGATYRRDRFLKALQLAPTTNTTGCFLGAPTGAYPTDPGKFDPPAAAIAQVEDALRARSRLALALGRSYGAFQALAEYNAAGEVEAGVSSVFDAVNGARAATGLGPIPNAVGSIVPVVAGEIIGGKQLRKLKLASARIRTALEGYREALVKGRGPSVSILQDAIGSDYSARIALWRRGYLAANGYLSDLSGSGLEAPTSDLIRLTASDNGLCNAVWRALQSEQGDLQGTVQDEYDAQLASIDQLIQAHQSFEKGAPIDGAQLAAVLDRLTDLANKLKKGTNDGGQ